MSENNDYIQLPPLKKDTPSDVVAFMWEYMKVPEDSREKVKNLLKDANENGVKIPMTSLPHRSYSRLLLVTIPMKNSPSFLRRWVSNMTWLSSSAVPSRKAVFLTT